MLVVEEGDELEMLDVSYCVDDVEDDDSVELEAPADSMSRLLMC